MKFICSSLIKSNEIKLPFSINHTRPALSGLYATTSVFPTRYASLNPSALYLSLLTINPRLVNFPYVLGNSINLKISVSILIRLTGLLFIIQFHISEE